MTYLISIIFGTLMIVFFAHIRNEAGAIILGLDAAGVDFCLQWLRTKISTSHKQYLGLSVFGGLVARAASLFLFLKLSNWWFGFNTSKFYLFAICLLVMVPVLSFVAAYKSKPQRD